MTTATSAYLNKRLRSRQECELLAAARDIIDSYDHGYLDVVERGDAEDATTLKAIGRLRLAVDQASAS